MNFASMLGPEFSTILVLSFFGILGAAATAKDDQVTDVRGGLQNLPIVTATR